MKNVLLLPLQLLFFIFKDKGSVPILKGERKKKRKTRGRPTRNTHYFSNGTGSEKRKGEGKGGGGTLLLLLGKAGTKRKAGKKGKESRRKSPLSPGGAVFRCDLKEEGKDTFSSSRTGRGKERGDSSPNARRKRGRSFPQQPLSEQERRKTSRTER